MKIKIGQWVRTKTNKIILVNKALNDIIIIKNGNSGVWLKEITKEANAPQELIQVGDLIKVDGYNVIEVRNVTSISRVTTFYGMIHYNHITHIYTPNEDKSQYTLQWSADNEK